MQDRLLYVIVDRNTGKPVAETQDIRLVKIISDRLLGNKDWTDAAFTEVRNDKLLPFFGKKKK